MSLQMFIGEGFEGDGVNAAHINLMIGHRNGVVGQAFVNSLAAPRQGHCPFMVIMKPNIPVKPMTLYANKAPIEGEMHGNATWGASQAGIAKAIAEALISGVLPPEAEDEWCIVSANWVNPACDNLDEVYLNNYNACANALKSAMQKLPTVDVIKSNINSVTNPFYTPRG